MAQLVAEAGCASVRIRLLSTASGDVCYPVQDDPALLRETLARKHAAGMRILAPDGNCADLDTARCVDFLEESSKLRSQHILAAVGDPDDVRPLGLYCDPQPSAARTPLFGCTVWTRSAVAAARRVADVEWA
jgi:hypothetical protein